MHKNDRKYKTVNRKHKSEVELAISLNRLTKPKYKTILTKILQQQ